MREEAEEPNWFSHWEEQLPSPEELTPLSQTLITPDLALAFDIATQNPNPNPTDASPSPSHHHHHHHHHLHLSGDTPPGSVSGGAGGDEPARTLKRPRLVWTPQLHKRFVDAVAHLGIKNAVPKTIMQLMSVDGLTRENVASHLQKYRLYLKRMQGLASSGGAGAGPISAADAATEQLFASGPVPHHFLPGRPAEPYVPFVPVHAQQFYQQQRQFGQFGGSPSARNGAGFDNGFLSRAAPSPVGTHRMVGSPGVGMMQSQLLQMQPSYADDFELGSRGGGGGGGARKVLTLFPTGED